MRLLPLVFIILFFSASAQTDSTVFNEMKKVDLTEYQLQVPAKWKKNYKVDEARKEQKFEFTGVGIPESLNNEPFTGTFTLRKFECNNINTAEDFVLSELTSYPDRVTPKGTNYEKDTIQIASGEKATMFSTRFYRHTKHLNYTRYDLVVYSKKRKAAYLLNVIYQYKDPTYAVEKTYQLKQYALGVFERFLLR